MGSKKVKTTSNETATTTPNLNPKAAPVVDSYYSNIGNLMNSDWSPYTAPNAILNNVFANAGSNMPGNEWITSGIQGTTQAIGSIPGIYDRTLNRAQLGDASLAQAPAMGRATLGDPTKVDLSGVGGYSAANAGQGMLASGGQATGALAKDYIDYYKPYADQALVTNTMSSFNDQAGRQTADYAAQAAKRGAFGGSRQAIGEAQLAADIARQGGLLRSQMEDAAFTRALGAAQGDAGNVTNANIATAGNATQASVANANNDSQRLMFNAGEQNKFGLQGQRLAGDAALANAGYANQFGLAQFEADNSNNQLQYSTLADLYGDNADRANQFSLAQFGADNSNNQLAYQTGTANDIARAGLQMDYYGQKLGQANQIGQLGGLLNQSTQAGMGQQLDIGQALQAIQEDANMAPAEKMALINQLLTGGGLLGTTSGQTITSNGTSTSKESGGLVSSLLGGAFGLGSAILGKK